MLKITFSICLSVLIALGCDAQDKVLSLTFEPSFSKHTTLTFKSKNGNMIEGELNVFENGENSKVVSCEKVSISEDKFEPILSFLKDYNYKIKGSTDTLSSERVFWRGDSTTKYTISHGNDGITVNGSFTKDGVTKRFAFWSPKNDSQNYEFVQKILAISNESFKKKKSLNQLKALQSYF